MEDTTVDPAAAYNRSLVRMKVRSRERKGWSIVKKTIQIWEEMCRQGVECSIKTGFACWGPAACWHLWIEDSDGVRYDLGQSISGINVTLLEELPDWIKRVDSDSTSPETEYKLYIDDPKGYWTGKKSETTNNDSSNERKPSIQPIKD
jgi:hypothetical protein